VSLNNREESWRSPSLETVLLSKRSSWVRAVLCDNFASQSSLAANKESDCRCMRQWMLFNPSIVMNVVINSSFRISRYLIRRQLEQIIFNPMSSNLILKTERLVRLVRVVKQWYPSEEIPRHQNIFLVELKIVCLPPNNSTPTLINHNTQIFLSNLSLLE
jgi:hypothetical protein